MVYLHLFLHALNLSILHAGILIMVQQVRLVLFSLSMVDYSMSFILQSKTAPEKNQWSNKNLSVRNMSRRGFFLGEICCMICVMMFFSSVSAFCLVCIRLLHPASAQSGVRPPCPDSGHSQPETETVQLQTNWQTCSSLRKPETVTKAFSIALRIA